MNWETRHEGVEVNTKGETECQKLEIELPIPMPTWNRILAMQHFERAKLREYLHHAVWCSLTYGPDWPTRMDFRGKQYSTALFLQEYFQMIRPNKSRKLAIAKLRAGLKKQ
jgi:hypothetical protein